MTDSIFDQELHSFIGLDFDWRYELKISLMVEDRHREAVAVKNIARFYYHRGYNNETLKCLNECLLLFQLIGDHYNEAMILYDIAKLHKELTDFSKENKLFNYYICLDNYSRCLSLFDFIDRTSIKQDILNNISSILIKLNQANLVLKYYQKSLYLSRLTKDHNFECIALNNIGNIYSDFGEKHKALEYYQQALSLAKLLKHRIGEAITLDHIGNIYSDLSENQRALEYFQQALVLNEEEGYKDGQASNLNSIGCIYAKLGETQKALKYFQQVLSFAPILEDANIEAKSLNNIGSIYSDLSEKHRALEYFQQALSLAQLLGSHIIEAATLNGIGLIYAQLGKPQRALEYYQQALFLNKLVGYPEGEALNLNSIGLIYVELEQIQEALACYQQALLLDKALEDPRGSATTLNNIGSAYAELGETARALEFYQQALLLNKAVGNNRSEANTLNNIAGIYAGLGEKKKAFKYFYQALSLTKVLKDHILEAKILSNIGEFKLQMKQYDQAYINFLQAIELLESINIEKLDDELKVSFFDTYKYKYFILQEILITQNRLDIAIEMSERGRGRILVNLLNKRFTNKAEFIPVEKPTINKLQEIARIHNSTFVIYSFIATGEDLDGRINLFLYIYVITFNGIIKLREIDLKSNNINLFQTIQIARKTITTNPGKNRDISPHTHYNFKNFYVGEYVKLKGEFPSDEPWQITAIDQEKGIVTLDQTLREAPLENVSIDRIASKTNTPLQQLHQILIEPIADLLPRNPTEKVIFMPQGALFGVPFPALQDKEGTYLLEKHTILTSPSIQVLAQTAQQNQRIAQQNKADHQPLIVGNPYPYPQGLASLENARQEAIDIANLLGTQPLLGQEATKAQVLAQMPKADILHFATHASFNDQNGIQSAIYLTAEPGAPDDGLFQAPGRITAEEIFNQFENNPLNARIAVLSACDTGQGEITGDGVIGLSRSLIAAGVPSVLVSLWSVNDASTKTLMTEFYRQWQTEGVDKATALRNAMLKLKEQYPEPYYWGAFTLIGEAD